MQKNISVLEYGIVVFRYQIVVECFGEKSFNSKRRFIILVPIISGNGELSFLEVPG